MPEARATVIVSYKDDVTSGLGKTGQSVSKFAGDLKNGFGGATQALFGFNAATVSTATLITGVALALKYAIDQASEAERVTAQTEAVIKSTGGAAGLTATQIAGMADNFSRLNAVDDETIQKAENVMLTFKKVGREIFPQAQQAAIDLSVAFGTDLQSATIMVGKALEDPIRGITALRRAGVSFTADQQELINSLVQTGHAAEAQHLIIQELNLQFGGSGAAAAKTYAGQLALLKINVDNLAEAFGKKLLPPLTEAAVAGNTLLTWNDNVSGALSEHKTQVLSTAKSYSEYVTEMVRAEVQAGHLMKSDLEAVQANIRLGGFNEELATSFGAVSESQFNATNTTQGLAAAYMQIGPAFFNANTALSQATTNTMSLEEAQTLLTAGLQGQVTKTQQKYTSTLVENKGELAKLTDEIKKYTSYQGQTVTITKEATTSHAEIEVAYDKQVAAAHKLSEAQSKLNENTDPDKQWAFQTAVNAAALAVEKSDEAVDKFEEGMGSSTLATVDNTKKIEELTARKAELQAKIDAAADALRRETSELLFNQASAALDAAGQLELARSLGLIDEKSYKVAAAMQALNKEYEDGTLTLPEYKAAVVDARNDLEKYGVIVGDIAPKAQVASDAMRFVNGTMAEVPTEAPGNVDNYRAAIANIPGPSLVASDAIDRVNSAMKAAADKHVTFTTDVIVNQTTNLFQNQMYVGGGVSVPTGHAAGGPVMPDQPYIVGERGPELFVPSQAGNIVPNDQLGGARGGTTYVLNLYTSSPQVNIEDEFEILRARVGQN